MKLNTALLVVINIYTVASADNSCGSYSHLLAIGRIHDGNTFWKTKTMDVIKCAQTCIRRKRCKSFNYEKEIGMCKLNTGTGIQPHTDNTTVHSDISKWPSQIDPSCYGRPCLEDEMCILQPSSGGHICVQVEHATSLFEVCFIGWILFGKKCYYFGKEEMNNEDASELCKSKGGQLVQIDTAEENDFLKRTAISTNVSGLWIDLYQFEENGKERWKTSDETPIFTDWQQWEPNDRPSIERCTILFGRFRYKWGDLTCADNKPSLCQIVVKS